MIPALYCGDIFVSQRAALQSVDAAILKTAEDEAKIDAKLAGPTTDQERTEEARFSQFACTDSLCMQTSP
jgi:hypothetical protein